MENLEYKRKNVWQEVDPEEYQAIFAYGEAYKHFLDRAKTEREATKYIVKAAEEAGFLPLDQALAKGLAPGQKIYLNNRGKSAVLMVLGQDILEGMHIVGAHIDSPRLDLKQNPLYESENLALFKTHYYGGIRKYQWPTLPLALYGRIFTQEGQAVDIAIGDDPQDPVFYVTDLLVHLSKDQEKKTLGEGIEGEQLNIVVGHDSYHFKDEKESPIKKSILKILHDKYGILEEDFLVAELEAVPAGQARDVGFDRAMIMGHGHDDRVCAFGALDAILGIENPQKTAVALFTDKEETGSYGNTGMEGAFFKYFLEEVLYGLGHKEAIHLGRVLSKTQVLSADVTAVVDPNHPEVMEKQNGAQGGHGVALAKYTGSRGKSGTNDANAEFLQEVRACFKGAGVIWQTGEMGKVDQGGGGTIAFILANQGCEVVDVGTPVFSMHAPLELISKADAYMTRKAYWAFLK
ncbi:MAG: aminopeptidase [Tissierellia bacterium]|nr:aminopeptidase [Tissierellia bacterium]